MKIQVLIFTLLTYTCLSQSEREEKLAIRSQSPSKQITISEKTDKTIFKSNSNQITNSTNNYQRVEYYDFRRWDWLAWGAPSYGYTTYIPSFYYDRWGLRQPLRTYNMTNGEKLEVKGEKLHWRLGLSYNTSSQVGGWVGFGNKNYFILEYSTNITNDVSSFIPNLTMEKAISWNDKKLEDIVYGGSVYVGGGIKINSFGIHISPGYRWTTNNFQFFDEFYILSNNGRYSFPNYTQKKFTAKFGVLYDYKYLTSKIEYNPLVNYINFGLGIVL